MFNLSFKKKRSPDALPNCSDSSAGPRDALSSSRVSLINDFPEDQGLANKCEKKPRVLGVLGAKGGVGATTIAVNLACCLAQFHGRATLVDANFQQPDAAGMLALDPPYGVLDLVSKGCRIEEDTFEACCADVATTNFPFKLLTSPLNGDAGVTHSLSDVAACLAQVKFYSNYWILDLPRHLDRHLVTLLDQCDQIVLVVEATLACVAAGKRWLHVFEQLGYSMDRVVCVLNRSGSKLSSIEPHISECFCQLPLFKIPNAFQLAEECSTHAEPVVLRHPRQSYSLALGKLSDSLSGDCT